MTKLARYLKPFVVPILVVIGLLFMQAYCELTLPDYMQNIVNIGIQNNGIEHGVYEQIRESTLEPFLMVATEDQKELIEKSYTLVTPDEASELQLDEIPVLKDENVYILNDISDETFTELENSFAEMDMTFAAISSDAKEKNVEIPVLLMQNGIKTYREQAKKQIEALGSSTVSSLTCQMVKSEYEAMGLDMAAIQQNYIIHSGLVMLGYALGSAGCAILVGFLASKIAAGLSKNLREAVFKKVTYFSNENFNKFNTSTLITRTTNDIQQVQMALVMMLRIVVYAPIMGIGALLHVMSSEANMTWIIALCVVLILSVVMVVFIVVMPKFKIMQKLTDKLNSVVRELLDGMLVIRAFNNEKVEEEKFDKANMDITKVGLFTSRAMAIMMPVMMFLMNGTTLLILWFGSKQVDAGMIQVGSIMAFMQYAMQVIMAFLMITVVSIMIPRANVSALRINEILTTNLSITDDEHVQSFDGNEHGTIRFENVSFRYPGADEDVLTDISFEAKPGEVTAFIGSTGSGKSTLINLVPRFYDVSEGAISIDGKDIRNVEQKELRNKIGYVPQKGILLAGTIRSNLLYANPNASDEDIDEALRISQSKEFVDTKPLGVDEPISQGGTNVSGGQKQRLSIARAIIKKPEIYIFDDSFSALDFKTDAALREELMKSCKKTGSTVLLVAQRISSILHADQIIVLDEGRMVGKGTHHELIKSCRIYQEIASSQLSKEELANV